MGGADELFGVRAGGRFEARAERVAALPGTAAELDVALPLLQVPFPNGAGGTSRHDRLLRVKSETMLYAGKVVAGILDYVIT